jgi:hypothetical protein
LDFWFEKKPSGSPVQCTGGENFFSKIEPSIIDCFGYSHDRVFESRTVKLREQKTSAYLCLKYRSLLNSFLSPFQLLYPMGGYRDGQELTK